MWVEEAVVSRLQHGASTVPTHILLVIERLTSCVGRRGGGQSTTTRCVHSPHTHILLVIERLTSCVGRRGGGQSTTTRCVHSPHTHSLSDREADILCG